MRTVLLITGKDLRVSLGDRSLLLLMFAAPLAIATIISVTFGGMAREAAPIESLPVAVINLDRGSPLADFGDAFAGAVDGALGIVELHVPPDEAAALEALRAGTVSAVIVLPEELSRRLAGPSGRAPVAVRVLTRADRAISAGIAVGLTRGILDGFAGSLAVTQAAVSAVAAAESVAVQSVLARPAFGRVVESMQSGVPGVVRVDHESLRSGGLGFNPLVVFGATQAIFFALFSANGNATSILEEERDATLMRLLASPSSHRSVLAGKLVSTAVMVLVQLAMLFLAFTAVASVLERRLVFIWGSNPLLILVVLLATSIAAAGIGAIVSAAAGTPEQSGVIGSVINMFMGVAGGAFGFRLAGPVRYASVVFWGADAFERLAAGGVAVWANVAVLTVTGVVGYSVAFALFERRLWR